MKKKDVNEQVLRAISIGLATFMAMSSPMTALAADGDAEDSSSASEEPTYQAKTPTYTSAGKLKHTDEQMAEHGLNNKDNTYTNEETSGAASVNEMNKNVTDAKKAESEAVECEETAETQSSEVAEQVVHMEAAVTGAENAISAAQDAKNEAENAVEKAKTEMSQEVEDYNKDVAEDNRSISEATDNYGVLVEADAAKNAAKDAITKTQQALKDAVEAGNELEKAESNDTLTEAQKAEAETEAKEKVDAAVEAADAAVAAAQAAITTAETEKNEAIELYNEIAKEYGLAPYSEIKFDAKSNPTLKLEDGSVIQKDSKTNEYILVDENGNSLLAKDVEGLDETIAKAAEAIKEAEEAVGAAQNAYDEAEEDYNTARSLANAALETANTASDDAADAADDAQGYADDNLNYYVTPAQNKEEIEKTYLSELEKLKNIDKTDAEEYAAAREAAVEALQKSLKEILLGEYDLSNDINQTEFDQALYEWAEYSVQYLACNHTETDTIELLGTKIEYENKLGGDDAKTIRTELNNKYYENGETTLSDLFNKLKISVDNTKLGDVLVTGAGQKAVMAQVISNCKLQLQDLEEKEAIIRAEQAALNAQNAADDAATAVAKAADKLSNVKALPSDSDITAAKTAIETATTDLNNAKATALSNLNMLDASKLATLLNQIKLAEYRVSAAKDSLSTAKKYQAYVNSYATYYDTTTGDEPTMTAYAQKNTSSDYGTSNEKDFDISDANTESRDTSNFVNMSVTTNTLTVPENIYRSYLRAVAYEKISVWNNDGKGVSDLDTLPTVYWSVTANEDGTYTIGSVYSNDTPTVNGTYFKGYAFKWESDGYHLDGYLVTVNNTIVTPTPTPVVIPTTGGDDTTPTTVDDTTPTTVDDTIPTTVDDTTVTLADTLVPMAASVADVDGLLTIEDEATPLAASLDDDGLVTIDDEMTALADSVPTTGDSSVPAAPFAAAGVLAIGAALLGRFKKKEN